MSDDFLSKTEQEKAENVKSARRILTRPDLYPEGSIGWEWAKRILGPEGSHDA